MKIGQLLYGIATFVPGVAAIFGKGGGDTQSARYCYSVWLRHLVTAFDGGLKRHPRVVAELGPGDSLGVGMAALVSGAEEYHAFDVVAHANVQRNQQVLDEIIQLFQRREAIPGEAEFPEVRPLLPSYAFPHGILGEDILARTMDDCRLTRIRESLRDQNGAHSMIAYRTRWLDESAVDRDSIDLLYSQAVLEHVDDLRETYRAMRLWLKPDGVVSHQIDFRCHNTARLWNGHWKYPDWVWKLIRGRRSYLLNREPCSTHLKLLAEHGFEVVGHQAGRSESHLTRDDLAPRFRDLTNDDLTTCSALIQAIKRVT